MATLTQALVLRRPTTTTGVWGWVTTVDHKRIGVLYLITAFTFFLVGGVEALMMRLQLAGSNNSIVEPGTFNALFTMHGTTMIFLAIMPLSAAFFNFLVPLMIGARDVAFPRLNAFSYWVFLFGALLLHLSFFVGGAPETGWFSYANLTAKAFSAGHDVDFWLLGLIILGISSVAAGLNFAITIINMRAPGMTMMRMPVFVWMTLVTNFLIIFAFPIITVGLVLLGFDRFFGTHFYLPEGGGDPVLWQHLFWLFGHPEVYILILPAMGIVSDVLPTFSRKPLFGYAAIVAAGVAIAFLGFSVWSHHMFTVGLGPVPNATFSATTMLIAIPTGVKIFNWIFTMWGGHIRFTTGMLFAIGFVAMFVIGGLSGVMHASPPVDTQQQDSYFVVAHLHYVLFGGSIFGIFAGLYTWFPKMTGRLLDEKLGKLHFFMTFIGFNVTFFPMHFLGLAGMPRRIYTYDSGLGWDLWNMVATAGAFFIALSLLVFLANVFRSLRKGEPAGNDPWDGRTLEWSIPSPPPAYNFAKVPKVEGRDPYWLQKHPESIHGAQLQHASAPAKPDEHPEHIHMPSPSYWPIVVAFGLALAASGFIFNHALIAIGVVITFFGIYRWSFEPASEPQAAGEPQAEGKYS